MKYCNDCDHFKKDGSWRIETPQNVQGKCFSTAPHCTLNPQWIKILEPEEHFCAYWKEKWGDK